MHDYRWKEMMMSKQAFMMKQGEGESLEVMGARVKFLCKADQTDKAWSLMEVLLPKSSGPPPHEHPWDEAYYVVDGAVRFFISGQEKLVKAGDFIYAPGGTVHAFQGDSDGPARMLIFDAPAHAESFFREVEQEVKSWPADAAKVPEIGERHQIHFLRP
jgi:quercetin dioxygenase-like cupin family protein